MIRRIREKEIREVGECKEKGEGGKRKQVNI